jgi:hypothetical protein
MPRQKNSNLPAKNSRTVKVYVSQEEYQQIADATVDIGCGFSDLFKLSWCFFRKSREEKPQRQVTKQSDRNEEIRQKAIQLSQKDYLEIESLSLAEELTKHHGFICLTVRGADPLLKTKKTWVLCSPYFKQSEAEKQMNKKDLFPLDESIEDELLEGFDLVKERY